MSSSFVPWDLKTILDYLDVNGGTVLVTGGAPAIQFSHLSRADEQARLAVILPHLKAKREVFLEYLQGFAPGLLTRSLETDRKAILAELTHRAAQSGKPVYYLLSDGKPVTSAHPPRRFGVKKKGTRVVIPVDREATHACVSGDASWYVLPSVLSDYERLLLSHKAERERTKMKRQRAEDEARYRNSRRTNPRLFESD